MNCAGVPPCIDAAEAPALAGVPTAGSREAPGSEPASVAASVDSGDLSSSDDSEVDALLERLRAAHAMKSARLASSLARKRRPAGPAGGPAKKVPRGPRPGLRTPGSVHRSQKPRARETPVRKPGSSRRKKALGDEEDEWGSLPQEVRDAIDRHFAQLSARSCAMISTEFIANRITME
jgi:hypothetical protein